MSDDAPVRDESEAVPTGVLRRSRGALSGVALVLIGAWAALAPLIGPTFSFAITPDKAWTWTMARGYYEVLPGCVAVLGGLLLIVSARRRTTLVGAACAVLAGGWLIIGPTVSDTLRLGTIGRPTGDTPTLRALQSLTFFGLAGALIVLFGAVAYGRLSLVSVRDLRAAEDRAALSSAAQAAADDKARQSALEHEAELQRVREHAERERDERAAVEYAAAQRDAANREFAEQHASQWAQSGGYGDQSERPGARSADYGSSSNGPDTTVLPRTEHGSPPSP